MQDILRANSITAKEETLRDPSQALCQICQNHPAVSHSLCFNHLQNALAVGPSLFPPVILQGTGGGFTASECSKTSLPPTRSISREQMLVGL